MDPRGELFVIGHASIVDAQPDNLQGPHAPAGVRSRSTRHNPSWCGQRVRIMPVDVLVETTIARTPEVVSMFAGDPANATA